VAAAGIHDDAGAFPGFNEAFAGVRAVELQNEIIHVGDLFQQISGVGVHFFQESAAVHNLAAWQIHHAGEGIDGVGQGGDAGGRQKPLLPGLKNLCAFAPLRFKISPVETRVIRRSSR